MGKTRESGRCIDLSRVVVSGPRGCGRKKGGVGGRVSSGKIKGLRFDEVGSGTGWGIINRRAVIVHIAQGGVEGGEGGERRDGERQKVVKSPEDPGKR